MTSTVTSGDWWSCTIGLSNFNSNFEYSSNVKKICIFERKTLHSNFTCVRKLTQRYDDVTDADCYTER